MRLVVLSMCLLAAACSQDTGSILANVSVTTNSSANNGDTRHLAAV